MSKFIDLTLPIDENSPVYPGDPKVKIGKFLTMEKDSCSVTSISFATHTGTHIDAPSHMIQNGKNLNEFSLDTFWGNGICVDVSMGFDLEKIKKAGIKRSDIVLFYSGWDKHVYKEDYYLSHPEIPVEIAQLLVDKKVKIVGIDFPTPDKEPYPIHKLFLSNEILIIESLANLDQVLGKQVTLIAFPLSLASDGAPVRVVALGNQL